MDFNHTEERRMVGDALSRWLREEYDLERRAEAMAAPHGYSLQAWNALGELGVPSVLSRVDCGGLGGEGYDIALIFEELGRALAVEPWIASALTGARLLGACGDQPQLLDDVMNTRTVVALAHSEPASGYSTSWVECRAESVDGAWRVSGHKAVALHADSATMLLVTARTAGNTPDSDGISLFLIDAAAAGVSRKGYATIDGLRAADVRLDAAPAILLGEAGKALPAVSDALAAAILAVCAESLGVMEVARDLTLDYLRTREQFGRPIGSFQALQHRMVDVATAIEQSRSLVIKAASVFDNDRAERDAALSAAKYYIGVAGRLTAEESIQMHGGIGIAGETPINHYAKRLVMIDHLFGDTDHHLSRYIELSSAE